MAQVKQSNFRSDDMKKLIPTLMIIIVGICILVGIRYVNIIKTQNKYEKMLNKIKEAVDWQNDAVFVIRDEAFCANKNRMTTTSDYLIQQGYLKKKDLLDIDGKSYCEARIEKYKDDNCDIRYTINLKCKDYSTIRKQ